MSPNDARRLILADPRHLSPEVEAFVREDAALAALHRSVLALDEAAIRGFGEAAAPKGLADRIILRARYRRGSRWLMAAAASVLIAAGSISLVVLNRPPQIVEAMLDHVVESSEELNDAGNVSPAVVRTSLAAIGVPFADAGYRIRHLSNCVIAGRTGRHLIIQTAEGVVSLLVYPADARELAGSHGLGGIGDGRTLRRADLVAVVLPQNNHAIGAFGASGSLSPARLDRLARQIFAMPAGVSA